MSTSKSDSVYFKQAILHNYGPFEGRNSISFRRHRTVIGGPSGSGKSTIFNTLAHLGAIGRLTRSDSNESSHVDISVEGDSQIIKDYHRLIFLQPESGVRAQPAWEDEITDVYLTKDQMPTFRARTTSIFNTLTSISLETKNAGTDEMSHGERHGLYLAQMFAVRQLLPLHLPVVIERPFAGVDLPQRQRTNEFLKSQHTQQILLCSEHSLIGSDNQKYVLETNNSSTNITMRSQAKTY
jgi:ABC-type glutathione transport system ATPase component